MDTLLRYLFFLKAIVLINGQFSGSSFMSALMNPGSNFEETSNGCQDASVSCLPSPWCKRRVDTNGCTTCDCNMGNVLMGGKNTTSNSTKVHGPGMKSPISPSQGINPFMVMQMNGGGGMSGFSNTPGGSFGSFGRGGPMSQMGPMNPMASLLGGNSMYAGGVGGPSAPMFGGGGGGRPMQQQQQQSATGSSGNNCARINTCMLPPPWCQRVMNADGCPRCLCGNDLQNYLQELAGVESTTELNPMSTDEEHTSPPVTHDHDSTAELTTEAPPLGMACLATFQCILSCDTGYQTDSNGCPVCACAGDVSENPSQAVIVVTSAPPTTNMADNSMVLCPGIFSCEKMCMNGFLIDSIGCPLCECDDS